MVSKTSTVAGSYTTLKRNKSSQNVAKPIEQQQFDLLYMPDNVFEGNTYKYILTGVEVASTRIGIRADRATGADY